MPNSKILIKTRDILIVLGFLIVMLVLGSFADYPISLAFHNEHNIFGILLGAYGQLPVLFCLQIGALLLFLGRNKERKIVCVLQAIGGVVLFLLGMAANMFVPIEYMEHFSGGRMLSMIIGVGLSVVSFFLTYKLSRSADRATMIRVAAVILLTAVVEMVIINVIKIPWGRPRMRLIAINPEVTFTPWWVAGSTVKDAIMEKFGVISNEFKSFPSGHTADAAMAMLLPLLTLLQPKWKGKESLLFFIGAAWGVLVALSRIIMGAHFVSDTMVGFAIALLVAVVGVRLAFKDKTLEGK